MFTNQGKSKEERRHERALQAEGMMKANDIDNNQIVSGNPTLLDLDRGSISNAGKTQLVLSRVEKILLYLEGQREVSLPNNKELEDPVLVSPLKSISENHSIVNDLLGVTLNHLERIEHLLSVNE